MVIILMIYLFKSIHCNLIKYWKETNMINNERNDYIFLSQFYENECNITTESSDIIEY